MGQLLRKAQALETEVNCGKPKKSQPQQQVLPKNFPDITKLPPELALLILSHLGATDLCLASCVWEDLGNDELLWHGLCRSQWKFVSSYRRHGQPDFSYKKLYLRLDEATLTFNGDPDAGLWYILHHDLVDDDPSEIAKFLFGARNIRWAEKRQLLGKRQDVLDKFVELQNFENQFLPNALRTFFRETTPPNERNDYLAILVEKFSNRFCACNPNLGYSKDTIYVVCFSLIMLSVDLASPHIKNKMSKREFIRNTRQACDGVNDDFAGHLYDNIYLIGHVAPHA